MNEPDLTEQMAELAQIAIDKGFSDAAEWIMAVYGGKNDPLATSQRIRQRACQATADACIRDMVSKA